MPAVNAPHGAMRSIALTDRQREIPAIQISPGRGLQRLLHVYRE